MSPLVLVILTSLVGEVPVLLDPEAARREALVRAASPAVEDRLQAAEALLLGRDPRGARGIVDGIGPLTDPALAARARAIGLDASVLLGEDREVEQRASALAEAPGWRNHAGRQALNHEAAVDRRSFALFGSIMFSLALAVMMIGGARELLRPRAPTVVVAVAVAIAVAAASTISPMLARVVALADLGVLALCHAAISCVHRVAPAPRGRVFLAMLVLAGSIGVVLAIAAPLPWSFVLGEVD